MGKFAPNHDGGGGTSVAILLRSLTFEGLMEIHFISSLTVDDEARLAAAMLAAAATLLDQFAVAFSIRIETTDGQLFQRTHAAVAQTPAGMALADPSPLGPLR